MLPELPRLPEGTTLDSPESPVPPPPIEKDPVRQRSVSSARHRPAPPPKERRRSGGSTLQLASSRPGYMTPSSGINRKRAPTKHQHSLFRQLTSIKLWFKENTKRGKSPGHKLVTPPVTSVPEKPEGQAKEFEPVSDVQAPRHTNLENISAPMRQRSSASYVRPNTSDTRHKASLSPAPATPRSPYRLSTGPAGLRGRKSTSSSVSSIRSIHHIPSHSKASSTSSTTNSIHSTVAFRRRSRSPHTSLKVLPSTPTFGSFPSNVRLVRAPNYEESANFHSPTAHVFAKRKRTPFRGPQLTLGVNTGTSPSGRIRESSTNASRSASVAGRASGEIIHEESEEEDIEEVETFSPIGPDSEELFPDSNTQDWIRRNNVAS